MQLSIQRTEKGYELEIVTVGDENLVKFADQTDLLETVTVDRIDIKDGYGNSVILKGDL